MSIILNNNNYKKENNKTDKNLFSLPYENTYTEPHIKKNNNNNFNISPSNKLEIQNNIPIRTQILSNFENNYKNEISKYINCKRHPKNIISFFCETDKIFPCSICISHHIEHKYSQFYCSQEFFTQELNKIKNIYGEVEIKYFNNKKNAEKFFLNVKNHFDDQIHKINDYFDSMISILQDKKSFFISKMLIIYENYIKELINFKEIFDICDQSYSNLYQKIVYIENEFYKKGDYESFYNIKDNIIKDINNFSLYNDEKFYNNNKFNFNNNSMPFFLFPKKQIININDDDILFGSFENAKLYLNNDTKSNKIENNNEKNDNKMESKNNNNIEQINININKNKIDNNYLIDSIAINSTLKRKDNNSTLKKNLSNLESLFEKNKNKNIFSSINTNISNINDSFIDKQLIETGSTFFLLNKNEVKNVFQQQDSDLSQNFYEKNETIKDNNNKDPDSPKFNKNNINKTKYTSCNKEKRNKQIIKKFLDSEELNRNETTEIYNNNHKYFNNNINKDQNHFNSNNITSFDNKSKNNTIDNDMKINNNNNKRNRSKRKKEFPPNIKSKNISITRKRSGSINKNINKNNKNYNSCYDLKNKKKNSKDKNKHSKKNKINNINRYFEGSYIEDNNKYDNQNINQNNQYLLTKNNNSIIRNQNESKNIHNLNKKKFKEKTSFEIKNTNLLINKYDNNQIEQLNNNFQNNQNEKYFYSYNINRSNSNRYKKYKENN